MIRCCKVDSIKSLVFKTYFSLTIFLAVVSLSGFFSGVGNLATVSGFFYLLISSTFVLNERFRRNFLSTTFCIFNLFFFHIPTCFVLAKGLSYTFADGILLITSQDVYFQYLPLYFLILCCCSISMWLGMLSYGGETKDVDFSVFSKIELSVIIALGLVVALFSIRDTQAFWNSYASYQKKSEDLLTFLFFDHAFFFLVGPLLIMKFNNEFKTNQPTIYRATVFIVILEFLLSLYSGSKAGGLFNILLAFIIIPCSLFVSNWKFKVITPSISTVILLIVVYPIIFFVIEVMRENLALIGTREFNISFEEVFSTSFGSINSLIDSILYRFSWGGLDRFIVVAQSYLAADLGETLDFIVFALKSFFNLTLPGTIFLEAYTPTSQIFPVVMEKEIANLNISNIEFISRQFNTQAYTLYGIFIIIFKYFAPIFLFIFSYSYSRIFASSTNIFMRILSVYFFWSLLFSFGIEVVVVNSIHLFLSMIFMIYCMRAFSSFLKK